MINNFDISYVSGLILKWRKKLFMVVIIAALASFIFSLPVFIKPQFKSSIILFPTASSSISKALFSESPSAKDNILMLGADEEVEQLLQILLSDEIKERIIKKYDLYKHYRIDTASSYPRTRLNNKFKDNFNFRKTEYMSVEVEVYDTDPIIAANMANDVATFLDTVKNNMLRVRAEKAFGVVEKQYKGLVSDIRKKEDSLTIIRKLGVQDYETQSEMTNEQMAIAISKNNSAGIAALQKRMDVLAEYGSAYVSLRDALLHDKKQESFIRSKYDEAKVDAEQILPQKFVVNKAYPAEKAIYPIRWLIIVISTISSFTLAVLVIIILERKNKKTN